MNTQAETTNSPVLTGSNSKLNRQIHFQYLDEIPGILAQTLDELAELDSVFGTMAMEKRIATHARKYLNPGIISYSVPMGIETILYDLSDWIDCTEFRIRGLSQKENQEVLILLVSQWNRLVVIENLWIDLRVLMVKNLSQPLPDLSFLDYVG